MNEPSKATLARPELLPPQPSAPEPAKLGLAMIFASSMLAAALLVGAIDGVAHFTTGSSLWPAIASGDNVSDADKRMRQQAFAAMAPLPLSVVADADIPHAVDGMKLPAAGRAALMSALNPAARPAPPVARAPRLEPVRTRTTAATRLVWLTLWDTDVEDGDVVRIESGGYSRTVTLTKAPLTFAIPAPADGVVEVVGVNDGDGGGITVGLASGAATAVFPVMSPGQTLGLRVALN